MGDAGRLGWICGGALAAALILVACTEVVPPPISGAKLFQDNCQACHGSGGRGDGPLANDLPRRPADLTGIAARNDGVFPMAGVMSTIDGYSRRDDMRSVMPEMGEVFAEGPLVRVDTGDGIMTPAPEGLVALADYLRTLQRP